MVSDDRVLITKKGNDYVLEDRGSTNGTYVNGKKIQSKILKQNDIVTLGGNKLLFKNDMLLVGHAGEGVQVQLPVIETPQKEEKARVNRPAAPYPFFQRSPRLFPQLPSGEINIPAPPPVLSKPTINWLTVLLPSGGMLMIAIVLIIIASSSGSGNVAYAFVSVFMALISVTTAVVSYKSQSAKFVKDAGLREENYKKMLDSKCSELKKYQELQKNGMTVLSPGKNEKLMIARERQRRMWERIPTHEDFLSIRLGLGKVPLMVNIKTTTNESYLQDDPLVPLADKVRAGYNFADQAPVCVPLMACGSAGIIGERPFALALLRSMVMDIAVHHSYDEVKIVVIYPEKESAAWDCLRWLPHVWDENRRTRYMAKDKVTVRAMFSQLLEVFKQRESTIRNHMGNNSEVVLPHYVFVIADQSLVLNEQLVPYIVHSRKDLGISSLFLFDRIENLPRDCGKMIHIADNKGQIINMNDSACADAFTADLTNIQEMDSFCRSLAPVRLKKMLDEYMLPQVVSFLDMYGVDQVEGLNIEKRWAASEPYLGLKAPIGMGTNGQIVDLLLGESARDHGVHGLVAGTTRSGKSEFLQTLILSLAVNYMPSDVAFVLVDYKGGAMANAFRGLPHLAGIITNLGGNQTERALASINSEIKRRQMLFEQAGVDTIVKYQKKFRNGQIKDPLPHLLIIVDEFAELKTEKPEFISKLVSAARVGGSLGIKLILATQKPTGVVDEQIKSNAGYSVCLKVQTAGDSKEMLDRPDAALINLPGRAYLKAGTDFVFELFQSAWSGAEYAKSGESGNAEICEVGLDGIRYRLNVDIFKPEYHESHTQLSVISEYIRKMTESKGIKATNSIWLPPLPESITLEELEAKNSSGERLPIIGLVDSPQKQSQYPLAVNFLKDGHLAVYGGPTSGKTTLLQTLIVSIARNYSPDEFVMYILDFGTRTMSMFEGMPSVGGVAMMDEEDKIKNLFKYLVREINQRKRLFSEADVSSIQSYRESSGQNIPAIVLLIDNFSSLLEIYPDTEDPLVQITRDGGNLGIFIVLTANTQGSVKYKVSGNIRSAIALQMVDKSDYTSIVGRTNGLEPAAIDGRGLLRDLPPLEFQTALPARGTNELERAISIKKFIKSLNDVWKGKRAYTIPLIPTRLEMNELMDAYRNSISGSDFNRAVPIGLSIEEIGPVAHDFRESQHLLIAGKNRTVWTAFLKAFVEMIQLEASQGESFIYVFDSGAKTLSSLKTLAGMVGYASRTEEAQPLFIKLNEDINGQIDVLTNDSLHEPAPRQEREIYIIICDFNDFKQMLPGETGLVLENIVRREHNLNVHIIMAGQITDIGNAWDGLGKAMRDLQSGLLLSDPNEQQVFSIRLPYSETNKQLKTSEGYYINHGSAVRVKLPNL